MSATLINSKSNSLLVFPIKLEYPIETKTLHTADPTIPLCPAMYIFVFLSKTLFFKNLIIFFKVFHQ